MIDTIDAEVIEGECRQTKAPKTRARKPAFELDVDNNGMPLLPETIDTRLEEKKAIIRSFITMHYSERSISNPMNSS